MATAPALTREEDAALRHLHFFEQSGASLTRSSWVLLQSLRARDARKDVREPFETVIALPLPRVEDDVDGADTWRRQAELVLV